jgi:hypothetical protein
LIPTFLSVLGLTLQVASGVTINLLAVADTALRDNAPLSSFGGAFSLPVGVGQFGSPHNHGLFKFSLAGIPTNATITSAVLSLIVVRAQSPAAGFGLSRMLTDWNESAATWNAPTGTGAWASPGAQVGTDYAATPSVTAMIGGSSSTNNFNSPGMIADVQFWFNNPGTNFGWILIASGETANTGKQLGSREDALNQPVLTIEYTLPGPTTTTPPVLTLLSITDGSFSFQFEAETNQTYEVQYRGDFNGTNWVTLTNIPAQPAQTNVVISDPLTTSNRFYRVSAQ